MLEPDENINEYFEKFLLSLNDVAIADTNLNFPTSFTFFIEET